LKLCLIINSLSLRLVRQFRNLTFRLPLFFLMHPSIRSSWVRASLPFNVPALGSSLRVNAYLRAQLFHILLFFFEILAFSGVSSAFGVALKLPTKNDVLDRFILMKSAEDPSPHPRFSIFRPFVFPKTKRCFAPIVSTKQVLRSFPK